MKIRNRNETSPENPLGTHQSPKFNIFGELVVTKSPAISNMKYPPGWGDSLVGKTKTELNQTRKSDMLPHASYDLDGDGYVSQADFRISKIFDEDKDGKLNDFERENADKAIKDGIIDKVVIEKELNSNGYLHTSKFNRFYKTDGFETQAGKTFAELKEERMNEKKKTAKELLEKVGDVQHMVYVANRKQD